MPSSHPGWDQAKKIFGDDAHKLLDPDPSGRGVFGNPIPETSQEAQSQEDPMNPANQIAGIGENFRDWDSKFTALGQRVDQNLGIEQGAIDDWRNRFKDQYFSQMDLGARTARGNLMADSQMGGANPALMRAAIGAGGDLTARNTMNKAMIGGQMSMADALAEYRLAQRMAGLQLGMHDMYGTMDKARMAELMNWKLGMKKGSVQEKEDTAEIMRNVYGAL